MIPLFVVLGIVVLLGGYFVTTQRSLVGLDERVKNALSQIGVQQNSRWDAITLLAKMVEKYSKHEHDTLLETIAARRAGVVKSANEVTEQQNAMDQILSRINVVAEQYPQLKASDLYANTMNQVNEFENKVRMSRQIYNDVTTMMNQAVRQWPSSIVANMLGFKEQEYLKVSEYKTEVPNF